ncbi:MAG: 4-hydroxy-3-methylbut-2-enyl diphosphate reductase [Cyanobacteriota bacterium]
MASLAGFCYGVSRAVDLSLETKKNYPQKVVGVLGKLIHNNQAINYLEEKGIKTFNNIDEVPEGAICVIRSHGEGPETLKKLCDKNVNIVDATCPDVKRVQNTAAQLAREGYQVLIIGQSEHPEVIAIREHVDSQMKKPAVIVSEIDVIEENKNIISKAKKVGVVVQTTKPMEKFTSLLSIISSLCYEVRAFNTICNTTSKRQEQAKELAEEVDFMVIIGAKHSSNTTNLAQLCKAINVNTVHIENIDELKKYDLSKFDSIGVTAGASTPKFVIDDVMEYLNNYKGE